MRVLHAALMATYEPGVIQQMQWEDEAAKSLGLKWDARLFVPMDTAYSASDCVVRFMGGHGRRAGIFARVEFWFAFRKAYYAWLERQIKEYDLLLLRQSMSDPFRASFIARQKRPVLSVHHTLEIPELKGRGGVVGELRSVAEGIFGAKALKAAAGVIGVTGEIAAYERSRVVGFEKKSLVYPNGIISDNEFLLSDREREGPVTIVFVASHFVPWHGLDLLLKDLRKYSGDFRLHLVGRVTEEDMRLIDGDSRVVVHGLLKSEQIKTITEMCDIGLASFALERKGMFEACTLKVREYLSRGVPVYAGHKDVFPADFRFYRQGLPYFSAIIDFAKECRLYSRREVAMAALPFIDKKALLKRLHEQLVEAAGDGRLATEVR